MIQFLILMVLLAVFLPSVFLTILAVIVWAVAKGWPMLLGILVFTILIGIGNAWLEARRQQPAKPRPELTDKQRLDQAAKRIVERQQPHYMKNWQR